MDANDRDRRDQWLDEALRQYGNVHPRAGLESRILASLAARDRSAVRQSRTLATIGFVATCLIILGTWSLHPRRSKTTAPLSSEFSAHTTIQRQHAGIQKCPTLTERHYTTRRSKPAPSKDTQFAQNLPRLEQFPSQRPLSEQERLLTVYVRQFPYEAVEVAREQAQTEKELEAFYSSN